MSVLVAILVFREVQEVRLFSLSFTCEEVKFLCMETYYYYGRFSLMNVPGNSMNTSPKIRPF